MGQPMRAWLIDKSAFARLGRCRDAAAWAERAERGLIRISTLTLLEIGYSARSESDMAAQFDAPPASLMPVEYMTPAAEMRSLEVLQTLAARGQHRAPSVPDLLIASIAEQASLVVLHVDKDFDLIAAVTGQPVERLE